MIQRVKAFLKRVLRGILSWASLLAIPLGIIVGLQGFRTLGALLVLGGTIAYFLVDPVLMLLDLLPSKNGTRRAE